MNNLSAAYPNSIDYGAYTITPNVVDYRWDAATEEFVCYAGEFDNGNEPAGRCVAGAAPTGQSSGLRRWRP